MNKLLVTLLAGAAVVSASAKPKDPVLMTVDGQPVTLSEFEYLYHKNADQQLEQESVEQYLQRFIDYKLKVAQARHERQDTTADYRKDFRQYRRELSLPFLADPEEEKRILEDAYTHTLEDVNVDHIMLPLSRPDLADSIRAVAVSGATDFLDLAKQFSVDPSVAKNGGSYGWISAGVYPFEFEDGAYNTAVGAISEVIETPYGLHLLRVNERRPNPGEVRAAHILVQVAANGDADAAKQKADSIYNEILAGKNFETLAQELSDCPSGQRGGDLDWFARGRMVPEFDEAVFSMKNGEISSPIKTRFGWHIIKRIDSRTKSRKQAMEEIKIAISRDKRSVMPRIARGKSLMKEYKTRFNDKGRDALLASVREIGYDSTSVVMAEDKTPLIFVGDSIVTIADFVKNKIRMSPRNTEEAQVEDKLDEKLISVTLVYEDHRLEQKYPEFRNLSREYSEGLMLFASMQKNVWDRPTTNPEELEAYFQANREKYAFEAPRWKGYIIYATSDSLMTQVQEFLDVAKPEPSQLGDMLKENFPKNIRVERVVLPKGENAIVDYVAFGGHEPALSGRWANYVTYLGHLIDAPEEVADVRGKVTGDWIAELEQQWITTLRERYPVKVNKKVLKKAK